MDVLPHVLREYALLADGERGALVGPRGELAWMCAPWWDSDAVFSSLLGGSGVYVVSPRAQSYVWGGHYEDGGLIWRSRWVGTRGEVDCREALALPGDTHRAVVLRRIEAVKGRARVRVVLDARSGFDAERMGAVCRLNGIWTARTGPLRLRWSGAADAQGSGSALVADLDLEPGERHDLVLEISDRLLPDEPTPAEKAWAETEEAWRRTVPQLDASVAPRDARHAYAVLRGLTSRSGGMVAAATTSLPERAEARRDYDYRYVWLRDQCYAGQAVAAACGGALLDDAVGFVSAMLLRDGPDVRPVYTVRGTDVPDVRELDLAGYPGGRACIGNRAGRQFQLDELGEALLLFAGAAEHDRLDREHWRAVETAAEAIARHRDRPDAGVWELDDQRWAHSRLVCVAGLRNVVRSAPSRQAERWNALADDLLRRTEAESLHRTGRWQRSPSDDRVDASLLMPAVRGALPPSDPRTRATLSAVACDLAQEHYLYRFRHDSAPLPQAEGAFLLSGFHMSMARHQQGEQTEAMRWFERNRAACGPPALFTEEYDVVQRQLRGNLPQAFVHAALLESAHRLARPAPDD